MPTKRAYSKTKKLIIYGGTTIVGLIAFLFTLTNYGINVELNDTVIKCAGNDLEPCVAYFNISLESYNLCFGNTFKLYLNDTDGVNYTLYKADQRYRPDNPARWKLYEMKAGTCLKNETKHEFKIVVSKPIDRTVKWGLTTGLINDIDPIFQGYNTNDFLPILIENYADLTYGRAKFVLKNPTTFNVSDSLITKLVDFSILKAAGTDTNDLTVSIEKTRLVSNNITDSTTMCNPYNETTPNGTIIINPNCTTVITGWHWENRTEDYFDKYLYYDFRNNAKTKYFNFTANAKTNYTILIEATWNAMLGEQSRDWRIKLNISNTVFEKREWQWWNTSYLKKAQINITANRINQTVDFYMSSISGFNRASARSDCADIEFANSTETGTIPFQLAICNSTDIEIVALAPDNTAQVGYVYYNNSADTVFSNISMRLAYDNFNDNSINFNFWTNNSKVATCDQVLVEQNGVMNQTTTTTYDNCAWFWYKNTTALAYETVIAKVKPVTSAGDYRLGMTAGILNKSSTKETRRLIRQYNNVLQLNFLDDNTAWGTAVAYPFSLNNWFWFMERSNTSRTIGRVWNATSNMPTSDTTSEAWAGRSGWLGLGSLTSWDEYQIWAVGYIPTFYANEDMGALTIGAEQSQPAVQQTCAISNTSAINITYASATSTILCKSVTGNSCTLYKNGTNVSTQYNNTALTYPGGLHNFTCANSTWGNTTWSNITQNTTNPVNLYFNGTANANKTYTYPEAVNATGAAVYSNSGTLNLYRGNYSESSVTPPPQSNRTNNWDNPEYLNDSDWTTGAVANSNGVYAYFYANFTAADTGSNTTAILIAKAYVGTFSDPNATVEIWNYTLGNWQLVNSSQAIGNYVNLTVFINNYNRSFYVTEGKYVWRIGAKTTGYGAGITGQARIYEVMMNFTSYDYYASGPSPQSEYILLSNGTYVYKVNITGNQNYSSNATGVTYYALVLKGTTTINLALNGTEGNKNYTYGQVSNASAWKSIKWGNITLLRNGTLVNSTTTLNETSQVTALSIAAYNYTAFLIHENYSAPQVERTARVLNLTILVEMPKWSVNLTEDTTADSYYSTNFANGQTAWVFGGNYTDAMLYLKANTSAIPYYDVGQFTFWHENCYRVSGGIMQCSPDRPCEMDLYYSSNNTWPETDITWNRKPSYFNVILAAYNVTTNVSWETINVTPIMGDADKNVSFIFKMNRLPGMPLGPLNLYAPCVNMTTLHNTSIYYPRLTGLVTQEILNESSCSDYTTNLSSCYQNGTFRPKGETNLSTGWIFNVTNIGESIVNVTAALNITLPSCANHFITNNSAYIGSNNTAYVYNISDTTARTVKFNLAVGYNQTYWSYWIFKNCAVGANITGKIIWTSVIN